MSAALSITVLAGAFLLLLIALILQRASNRRLNLLVAQLETELREARRPQENFSEDLVVAERNCPPPKRSSDQGTPDHYRYISAMARQGMNAAQIAKVLRVGEEEAAQIVRLARLKRVI
jgi:hypothetical protein